MIVIEAGKSHDLWGGLELTVAKGTIVAYDYLQTLSGLDYLLEQTRIVRIALSASM